MAWGVQSDKAVSVMAHLRGIEGSGMVGPSDTSGSPWPPLAICPCRVIDLNLLHRHNRDDVGDAMIRQTLNG
jgi:hypothetical protein